MHMTICKSSHPCGVQGKDLVSPLSTLIGVIYVQGGYQNNPACARTIKLETASQLARLCKIEYFL